MSRSVGYRGIAGAIVATVVVALYAPVLLAAAAISQGYVTEEALAAGVLVSRGADGDSVRAASPDNAKNMVGVASSQALLEISGGRQEVQVATSGTVNTFVSTLNGEVEAGDHIAPSPVAGVGMRATDSGYVVGVVAAGFDKARNVTEKEIIDKEGKATTIKIGLLPVQINVAYYEKTDTSLLPEFIANLAREIAGREVSAVRVIAAGVILAIGLSVAVGLVSSSVRSSIISIGRNPLAAKAVHRGMFEASGLAIGILLVVLIGVYLVLVI